MGFTAEEKNFYRFTKLLIKYGGTVLQKFLCFFCTMHGITFEQFLENSRHDLLHIKKRRFQKNTQNRDKCCLYPCDIVFHSAVLTDEQWTKLFVNSVVTDPQHTKLHHNENTCFLKLESRSGISSTDLDITLLTCLLTNIYDLADKVLSRQVRQKSTFEEYLKANGHKIYHSFDPSPCCECPTSVTDRKSRPCFLRRDEFECLFRESQNPVSCVNAPVSGSASSRTCRCMYIVKRGVRYDSFNLLPEKRREIVKKLALITVFPEVSYLREMRNKVHAHNANASLTDQEFKDLWKETTKLILDLANSDPVANFDPALQKTLLKEMSELVTCTFEDQWVIDVKDWIKTDSLQMQMIFEQQELIQDGIHEILDLLTSAEGRTRDLLSIHLKESRYISPKRSEEYVLKELRDRGVVIITGFRGSGKTTLANQCMARMCNALLPVEYIPMILTRHHQWQYVKRDANYVMHLEDIIGKSVVNEAELDAWENEFLYLWEKVSEIDASKPKWYIIISIRHNILKDRKLQLQRYDLFRNIDNCAIDLSSKDYEHTEDERVGILKTYCSASGVRITESEEEETQTLSHIKGIPDAEISHENFSQVSLTENSLRKIARINPPGFPLLCSLFLHTQPVLLKRGLDFFMKADESLVIAMDSLCDTNCKQYCSLLFLSLSEQKAENLYERNKTIGTDEIRTLIKSNFGLDSFYSNTVDECLQQMENVFIYKFTQSSKISYQFKHSYFEQALLISFGKRKPDLFISVAPVNILQQFIRPSSYKANESEVCLCVPKELDETLLKRLALAVQRDPGVLINHALCEDVTFVQSVITQIWSICKQTTDTSFSKILLKESLMTGRKLLANKLLQMIDSIDNISLKTCLEEMIRKDWREEIELAETNFRPQVLSLLKKTDKPPLLILAAESGSKSTAQYLVEKHSDKCHLDYVFQGRTFFHYAIDNGWVDVLTGMNIPKSLIGNQGTDSLLEYAARSGNEATFLAIYGYAKHKGSLCNQTGSILVRCIESGKIVPVTKILQDYPDALHTTLNNGFTPLSYSAFVANRELTLMIIDMKANLDANDETGKNIISYCIENDRSDESDDEEDNWCSILQMLLESMGDDEREMLCQAKPGCRSALYLALEQDKFNCLLQLLKYYKILKISTEIFMDGENIFHGLCRLCASGQPDREKMLTEVVRSLNMEDGVKLLLNKKNNEGYTPLTLAVSLSMVSAAESFVDAGADVHHIFPGTEQTVSQVCCENGLRNEMWSTLIQKIRNLSKA